MGLASPFSTLCWWWLSEFETLALNSEEVTVGTRSKRAELRPSYSKNDGRTVGSGRIGGRLRDACCTGAAATFHCPVRAVEPGDPFFPNEHGARGARAAFQRTVEAAAEFINLSTRGPRGVGRVTGHTRRRIGAEAPTVAGVEVLVAQAFSIWGQDDGSRTWPGGPAGQPLADRGEASSAGALRVGPRVDR